MTRIVADIGAAIFFIKGINEMTDKVAEECRSFLVFRAIFWSTLSAGAVLAFIYSASLVLSQVFLMWGNNV